MFFKLLDDAAFFAVNSIVEGEFVLTASFWVDLIRPAAEGTIRARGRLVHAGRRRYLAEADVVDPEGRLLARGGGTFMPSGIVLDERVGYRSPPRP